MIVSGHMDSMSKTGAIIDEVTSILVKRELDRPEVMKKEPNGSDIVMTDVHFGYKDQEVLHGIDLTIKEGTVNALVGPSGSGKSTIAKLIASFWDVDEGFITFGGVDIRDIPLAEYNKNIAYVSQDNYLFDETVMNNIRMGRPGATDEEVIAAAKACGCHEFIMGLEQGYDTIAGGAGGHLSGGERQRISIARAMLKNAPVVILDEATAYTDPENEALVQRSVAKLISGKTLIVIAHRLSTIATADNIIVINDGRIEASGTQDELLVSSRIYKEMWNAHISSRDSEVA
jgi:ATP-binding cassette subfamily B protein